MGQCISYAARENEGDKKSTTAQRICKWPVVPGPLPQADPKSPVSGTLTGGGGLALNIRASRKAACLGDSLGKNEPLAIIYAHQGKSTRWRVKERALSAALALRHSRVNAGARAAALGAAAARAAAATTTISSTRSSCTGSENGNCRIGGDGGGNVGRGTAGADLSFSQQCPLMATEVRAVSCIDRSSLGSNLGPPDEKEMDDSDLRTQPGTNRPGPSRGLEMAWMDPEAVPQPQSHPQQQEEQPLQEGTAGEGSGRYQQEASFATTAAGAEVEAVSPVEEDCVKRCSVLDRKSSHLSTLCQDLDGGVELWPEEVHGLMSGAAVAAAVAAAAVAAAAAAAAAARSGQVKSTALAPSLQSQPLPVPAIGSELLDVNDGKSVMVAAPGLAASGSWQQQCASYPIGIVPSPLTGKSDSGGATVDGRGNSLEGGSGRWASRLAPDIPSPSQGQKQEQQRLLASSPDNGDVLSPSKQQRCQQSFGGDVLNSLQRQATVLAADGGGASPRLQHTSTPGSANPLLRRATTNWVRAAAAAAVTTSSTSTGCAEQPRLGDAALPQLVQVASSGNTALGTHSESGAYDPSQNADLGSLEAAGQGPRVTGLMQGQPAVMHKSSDVGQEDGSGPGALAYEQLEIVEAEVEPDADITCRSGSCSRQKLPNVSPITSVKTGGRMSGGGGGGGSGSDDSTKWTRSRAGRTLDMLRMQAVARRVVDDATKRKQEQVRLEYMPQTSLQRRPCSPSSTPHSPPLDDGDATFNAVQPRPRDDSSGGVGTRLHQQILPQALRSPVQQQQLNARAAILGPGGFSHADPPEARAATPSSRKVVSERVLGLPGRNGSSGGVVAASAMATIPIDDTLYSVPGSTEPVPAQNVAPQLRQAQAPRAPAPAQTSSNPHFEYSYPRQNTLWLYPQQPRHTQSQSQSQAQLPAPQSPLPSSQAKAPLPPPPQQQQLHSHSGHLLKAWGGLQQQQQQQQLVTQPSLGRQARAYFHQVSLLRGQRPGSPSAGKAIQGGATGPATGDAAENIIRRSTYSGEEPGQDITSDRTMRLYRPAATTTKTAALVSKQQSGKLFITGVMAKKPPEVIMPPPKQLQRKESRRDAGGVAAGADVGIGFAEGGNPMGSQLLDHTAPALTAERSWPVGSMRSSTLCEFGVPPGKCEGGGDAAPPTSPYGTPPVIASSAISRSRSQRLSEPSWPTRESPTLPPPPTAPQHGTAAPAAVAAAPLQQLPAPLPGLWNSDFTCASYEAMVSALDAQLTSYPKVASVAMGALPLPVPPHQPVPSPVLSAVAEVPIGASAQPHYQAYVQHYQLYPSHQPSMPQQLLISLQ